MNLARRFRPAWSIGWVVVGICYSSAAWSQPFLPFPSQFELSAVGASRRSRQHGSCPPRTGQSYVADGQWDEAVETLRQVMENNAGKVIPLTDRRYINLGDYCHLQIAALPAPALKLYRQRVDPLAEKWYEEAIATRNVGLLSNLVNQLFCASVGDEALLALGELRSKRAPRIARGYWERIIARRPKRAGRHVRSSMKPRPSTPADRDAVKSGTSSTIRSIRRSIVCGMTIT